MSCITMLLCFSFFFFNDTATTEIYTLSLHDALPISHGRSPVIGDQDCLARCIRSSAIPATEPGIELMCADGSVRSEEHTSELQSQSNLVCRLLLEKKKRQ